jgi:zeaxanthin glucosyltransferase
MKFGFIAAPVAGHMNPMIALGRRLQSRGHEVVFFNILDVETLVRKAGLGFVAPRSPVERSLCLVPQGYTFMQS